MIGRSPILLFDLGGVLVENTGFHALQALLPYEIGIAALKERWLISPVVRRFELGQISPSGFAHEFLDEWDLDLSPQAFISHFLSWPKGFYTGAERLLYRLRSKYRVGCLSNSNELHWEKFGGFADKFDVAYSSHLLGRIKPDLDVFNAVTENLEVRPRDIYFFDDALPNILSARKAGIHAFHVDGIDDVERTLRSENLL